MAGRPRQARREITVADVARQAGVAKATASRALGGYGAVSDPVRTRVLIAAEQLGYRPNELARSMNTGRSNTIGVIVGDIENSYFGLAMRGISDTAKAAGYDVILINTSEDVGAERDAVRVLLDKRVDALIVAPASAYEVEHLHDVAHSDRPLVLLDRRIDGLDVAAATVSLAAAAYQAANLLFDAGHEHVAFISALSTDGDQFEQFPLGNSAVSDRLHGILRAVEERGRELPRERVRFKATTAEHTLRILAELRALPTPPTALIASDSLIALNLLLALRNEGITVPDDMSLVAFDNFQWTELTSPPLTVVAQPIYDVGVQAAKAAISLLVAASANPADLIAALPAELVVRDSVAPPAEHRAATTTPSAQPAALIDRVQR